MRSVGTPAKSSHWCSDYETKHSFKKNQKTNHCVPQKKGGFRFSDGHRISQEVTDCFSRGSVG